MSATATLEVVVLTTPDQEPERPSIERVAAQSRGAREALSISAELSGAHDGPWQKDVEHVPLPRDGWHWSISHDAHWSAAIVGRSRVGIDVERIERRRGEMVEALISPAERLHLTEPDGIDALVFARIWTAKEAVLKSFGIGLGALSRCVLAEPMQADTVLLAYSGERCLVRQHIDASHVLSIHAPGNEWKVRWHLPR